MQALLSLGQDPDGVIWADGYRAAVMAESTNRVPSRAKWIGEYSAAAEADAWVSMAGI